jgi:ABC-type uncharacterized transport system permease subunit
MKTLTIKNFKFFFDFFTAHSLYFLSKVVAEAPLSAALSCFFGGILYPLVGFQAQVLKFIAMNIVHSLSSSATGLMIGAVAPSSEVALAMLPPIVVLQVHILEKKKKKKKNVALYRCLAGTHSRKKKGPPFW